MVYLYVKKHMYMVYNIESICNSMLTFPLRDEKSLRSIEAEKVLYILYENCND